MSDTVKYLLDESRIPKDWYNIVADLPRPPEPVLHPGTFKPVGPQDLEPLFPMALIQQEVSAERGSVNHHRRSEGIDRHRVRSPQLHENRKLRRAQPARRQKLIIKLRNVPCGLANGETVAVLRSGVSQPRHRNLLP